MTGMFLRLENNFSLYAGGNYLVEREKKMMVMVPCA